MGVKTADKLHCPLLDKACIRDECMFWASYQTGEDVVFNCSIAFLPMLITQGVIEQMQTQRTVQHQTNQMFATFRAMQQRLPIPRMSGNFKRDERTLKILDEGGDGQEE